MPEEKPRWTSWAILAVTCALVIGVYARLTQPGYLSSISLNPADQYYNLLVQGFRAGQLHLKTEVPEGLAQLADPYDPSAHGKYPVLDMSYYKGKLYLYYGVTPAVLIFWPYAALTGRYLPQEDVVLACCIVGFLMSAGLMIALWRRYFPDVHVVVVAAGVLALGLITCIPSLLARCDVWEVSISCGYAMSMLALVAIWKSLHNPEPGRWWLGAASLSYGLAVGARPSLLFGALILLVPVAQAWRKRLPVWPTLIAAIGPAGLVGIGLMFYNARRFDNPFEFGVRYVLSGDRPTTVQPFSLRYFWFHLHVYFLSLANWNTRFPFVHDITVPHLPRFHGRVEHPFGVLTNIPLVWFALAALWVRRGDAAKNLGAFLIAVAVLLGINTLTLCLFFSASIRYEVEFLPALVLLTAVGMFELEHRFANRLNWRRAIRWCWGLLLVGSVTFNLLASAERCAEAHYDHGNAFLAAGRTAEAAAQYQSTLRLKPDFAEAHNNLGNALERQGRSAEATRHYEDALAIKPGFAEPYNNLGIILARQGRLPEAVEHWEHALQLNPDFIEARLNLGTALLQLGRLPEAIQQFDAMHITPGLAEVHDNPGQVPAYPEQTAKTIAHDENALQARHDLANAYYDLGVTLARQGRMAEAIDRFEQALRLDPDYVDAHTNLGTALLREGKLDEAIRHYAHALRLEPDKALTHFNLGVALEQDAQHAEAIEQYQQALRIEPDLAEAHNHLGNVFFETGRLQEAADQYQESIRLDPDSADAHSNLGGTLLRLGRAREAISHFEHALRLVPGMVETHFNLGIALEQSGNVPAAIKQYEIVLQLKPGFVEAQDRLKRLQTIR